MTSPTTAEDLIREAYREAVDMCDSEAMTGPWLHTAALRVLAEQLHCAVVKLADARSEIASLKAEKEAEKA